MRSCWMAQDVPLNKQQRILITEYCEVPFIFIFYCLTLFGIKEGEEANQSSSRRRVGNSLNTITGTKSTPYNQVMRP